MTHNCGLLKDLFLEDYRYRAEELKHSKQSGETRVNIFIGFMTLMAGGLAALSTMMSLQFAQIEVHNT